MPHAEAFTYFSMTNVTHKVFGCGTFTSLSQFFKTSLSTSKLARLEYLLLDNCKNLNAYSAIQVAKLSSKLKMLTLNGLALSPDNVQVIVHLELSRLFIIGLTGAVLSVETAEIFFQNHSIFVQFSPQIQFEKPKPNLTPGELQALQKLSRDKTIILKKADKGTTSVMMSKESKINEGLALLNEKNNYQPLTQSMVETTTKKVTQLLKSQCL